MSEQRPLMTTNDLWQMLAGYALAVSALVLWPDKSTWTSGTVVAVALGALLSGWLAWIVLVERRLPRLPSWSGSRQPRVPGALAVAFLVFTVAFIVNEGLRMAWPDHYEVFSEPLPSAGTDGMVVWDFAAVEIPVNTARRLIAYFAVAFGGLALGSGLLQGIHAWRAAPGGTALIQVRSAGAEDRHRIAAFLEERGMRYAARLGELHDPGADEALLAEDDGDLVGVMTYRVDGPGCEVSALYAATSWRGIGSALIEAVVATARAAGCERLWLVTTNDNVDGLRFYQRRGFRLTELHVGAVDLSRSTLKPSIPEVGDHGIPLHDELVLERRL